MSGVRFGPPATPLAPFIAAGIAIACNVCAHDAAEHSYLYTLGTVDLYRCKKRSCPCGAQSEVRGVELAENPSEAQLEAAMAALAAGGGRPVRVDVK